MKWVKANKGFVSVLGSQLVLLIIGLNVIGGYSDEGAKLATGNRGAEQFVAEEAIDGGSVRDRERQNGRMRQALAGLERAFAYGVSKDLVERVGTDPNNFTGALRDIRGKLRSKGLRFPDTLGFPTQQPKPAELRLRVWQLDMIRRVLRVAQEAGVEELPAKDGIRLPKLALINPDNYVEFARVDFKLIGKASSLARVLHGLVQPGKYLTLEKAAIDYTPDTKGKKRAADTLPVMTLTVAGLHFNVDKDLAQTGVAKKKPGVGGGSRFDYNFGKK